MRDDNTEPRDNQQIADDNQQSGAVAPRDVDEQITNRETDEDAAFEDADDDDEDSDEDSEESDAGAD
jgi:hypothetical protein